MLAFAKSHGSRQVLGPYLLEGYDLYPYHPIPPFHTFFFRDMKFKCSCANSGIGINALWAVDAIKSEKHAKRNPKITSAWFSDRFFISSKTTRTLSSPSLLMADRLCARLVRSFPHIQCSFLSRSHFIWLKQSADFCSLYPVVNFCDRFFFKESTAPTFKSLQILASYKFGSADADIHSQDPFMCSIDLYRHCLGEPQGATILYRLLWFFWGTSACRSHEKPPNQTKHLEDATKWPHKLDRKILDWPGSSKATQAIPRLVGGSCCFQPWDGLCSFAAARPVQDLSVYLVWPLGRIFQVFGPVTKWWPLGLSGAVPVQNGGPWGCVTRLVGGSCHTPKGHHFVQAMPWRAPGATILYRLLWFFFGYLCPKRTKRLEGATKWLDKVERKILDWPGSSKGKSHLPALSHTPNCHHFVQALPQRAPGATILYRLLWFLWGTSACRPNAWKMRPSGHTR